MLSLFCLPIDPVSIYVSDMCTLQRDYVVAFSTTLHFRAGLRAGVDLNVRCAGILAYELEFLIVFLL